MRKLALMLTLVMDFGLATVAGATAYQPYDLDAAPVVDLMDEGAQTRAGIDVPKDVIDLSTNIYSGDFTYEVLIYANYLLKTPTGKINATVSSKVKQAGGNNLSNIQHVALIKKNTFGTQGVDRKEIKRTGTSTVQFSGLEKNKGIYFLSLSKATDGTVLTGTIRATK